MKSTVNLRRAAVIENDGPDSMMSVFKRHEKQIREFSAYNIKSVRRRTLGATLLDTL